MTFDLYDSDALPAFTPRIAYISFDVVPSHKGAAVHIESFVRSLANHYGTVELVTVAANSTASPAVNWPGVTHTVLPAIGKTLIDRVMCFRRHLRTWLQGQWFDVIQVRSIFEGMVAREFCESLIFEVNGLPSIELKYRYPKVAEDVELMHKLKSQEQACLEAADKIVTPSHVTKAYLAGHGVCDRQIQVIPNGVDLLLFTGPAPAKPGVIDTLEVLYFGTLSTWQGVELAIEAIALYRRDFNAQLKIVGPARGKQASRLQKLAHKLGIASSVQIFDACSQAELAVFMHQTDVIVAPLKANDRNLVQGCCPLKVLEGMASGTPVITSDLPVVTDLGESEKHFLAVRPGSAKAIKDAMLRLRVDEGLRKRLAVAGRSHVETHYTWHQAHRDLASVYNQLSSLKTSQIQTQRLRQQQLSASSLRQIGQIAQR